MTFYIRNWSFAKLIAVITEMINLKFTNNVWEVQNYEILI